jgi:hypothetical protein
MGNLLGVIGLGRSCGAVLPGKVWLGRVSYGYDSFG